MTHSVLSNFAGQLSVELAVEKRLTGKRKPTRFIEKQKQLATAPTDLDGSTDEALEPADTAYAHVLVPNLKVEDVVAIGPGTKNQASADIMPKDEPRAEMMLAQDEAKVGAQETAVGAEADAVSPSEPRRLFFLTNRMNLNGILSTLVLAPRESFHKYYADLLELSPGWVPLLTVRPPARLVERVVAERGSGAPVLLELSESVLNGRAPDSPVTYVRAALLSDVVAIHFREEKSLHEHRARRYGNVRSHEDLLRVSPELFMSATDAEFQIGGLEEGAAADWMQINRARGAVNGLLAAGDSGEGLAVAAGVLGAPQIPEGTVLPHWLTWDALTGVVPLPATESEAEQADRLIFQTAYHILGERDQADSWSPSEVLSSVASDIAATHPSAGAQSLVDRNLQHVRSIVNVERDFEPFRNSRSPYVAAKSFLMVLLRPDLGQLLEWPEDETGADATTRTVAAVLAGRLRGLSRESVELRNMPMDEITAAYAVRRANGAAVSLGVAAFVAHENRTTLLLKGVEIKAAGPLLPIGFQSAKR